MVPARPEWAWIRCSRTHPHWSHCTRRSWCAAPLADSPTSRTTGRRIAGPPCGRLLNWWALRIRMWLELQGSAGTGRTLWRTLEERTEGEELISGYWQFVSNGWLTDWVEVGGSANNHDNRDYSRRDVPRQLNSNGLLIKNCTEWWVTVSEILFRGRYWPRAITSYYSRWNDHHQGVILGSNVIFSSPRHSCSLRTEIYHEYWLKLKFTQR